MHKIFIYETNQCLMLKTNYQKPTTKPQFRKMLENNLKRGKKNSKSKFKEKLKEINKFFLER